MQGYLYERTFNRRGNSGEHCIGHTDEFAQEPIFDAIKAALPGVLWRLGHDGDVVTIYVERTLTGEEFGNVTAIVNSVQAAG